jgi:metal-dependent amidase/aminoacylase/carboxypeptidase family protein
MSWLFVLTTCITWLRLQDPLESGVVTCGTIKGGYGYNIIADSVEIVGTARTFTTQTQDLIKKRMQCICCGVAQTYGGEIDVQYLRKFCSVVGNRAHQL